MDKKYCAYICAGCGIGDALDMEALAEVVTGEMSMECKTHACLCGADGRALIEKDVAGGAVILDIKSIGEHQGFPFYTIGQRKGLGIAHPDPLYVTEIDYKNNTIRVGYEQELYHKGLIASKLNLIKYRDLLEGKELTVKIRYKDSDEPAFVKQLDGSGDGEGSIRIEFSKPKRAITPGQSVVFYEGDDLVGGAIIDEYFQ